jgi:hypothetical protein
MNCSRLAGVKPANFKASEAEMRYGFTLVFIMFCEGINCPWNPRFRMGSPENSGFKEVTSTRAVWRDVDRLETVSVPSA